MEGGKTSHIGTDCPAGKERPSAAPGILKGESAAAPQRRVSASSMCVRMADPELRSDFSQILVCIFIFIKMNLQTIDLRFHVANGFAELIEPLLAQE